MAEIDGGTLSFKSELDNDQLKQAIDETIARVQGLSDASVAGGEKMADAFGQAAQEIRKKIAEVGAACEQHEQAIANLEDEYTDLGKKASTAFMAGRDSEARAIQEQQKAVRGEIRVRQELLRELREQSNVLDENATKYEQNAKAAADNATAHQSMRARIKELKEALVEMEASGQRGTEQYRAMQMDVARLTDAWGDAQTQATILANDQAGFQGVIAGLNGMVGGFTAVSSAVSLFAGENENLQAAMLKVQQLMAITMGLQQVSEALNKDSAFQLVTLNGLKEWWNNLLAVGTGAQAADTAAKQADVIVEGEQTAATAANTAATTANTAAKTAQATANTAGVGAMAANTAATGAQAEAATAGTAANITLAGAFRMVGAAISSIPVFGWIAAGITALISVISIFSSKASEAKKKAEEFYNGVAENAYKPIANVEMLATKWAELGDKFEAKQAFIEQNRSEFDELGVSINGVTDAENLLVNHTKEFIDAQIEKAKAAVYLEQAQEKVKELVSAEQELAHTAKTAMRTIMDEYGNVVATYEVTNEKYTDLEERIAELKTEITNGYKDAAAAESEGIKKLENAGIEATKKYAEGTLGAIEQAIRLKQEALKNLTNNDEYKAAMDEIIELQKQASAITGQPLPGSSGGGHRSGGGSSGGGHRSGGGGSKKDPFTERLEKMKAEYTRFQKWMNSGDDILMNSAKQEFSGILKQGATYIEYLKNQRDQILAIDVAGRTKEQNRQLRELNNSIAEETRNSVLQAFNDELNTQLSNARTIIDQLNIIEERRKQLANDGTELDNEKADALNDAEEKAKQQAEQEMTALLDNYAGYVERKRQMEQQFNDDIALMERARLNAKTDDERAAIDVAIANRKKQYEKDSKSSGDADYDNMLTQYKSFEQGKQDIIDDYAEKRRIAQEHGNAEMVAEIDRAEREALSKFATDAMQASPDWSKMFVSLDELSTAEINKLIKKINGMDGAYLGIEFDPKDLETLMSKLEEMKNEVRERNPFGSLISSIKEYSNAADNESKKNALTNMLKDSSESCKLLSQGFQDVSKMLVSFGMDADSETAEILGNMSAIAEGAASIAEGIATMNPAAILSGVASVVSTISNWLSGDSKKERQIKKWQAAVDDLANSYNQLAWEIDKALGGDVYKNQQAAIRNMKEQQAYLQKMWEEENSKKHGDQDKVRQYKEQYAQLGREIDDMLEEIANDITQTDAKSFASDLASSLTDAFKSGENAAKSFDDVVNNVLQNAVVNQLKKKFLEQQLQGALDNLSNSMGHWQGDDFIFDGLTDAEIAAFKAKVQATANNYNEALKVYEDLFDASYGGDTSLSGAISGVSEETASIIAGQMNAIRINQLEQAETLRQHLMQLSAIASNTEYCRHLAKIDQIINLLQNGDASLRSQGLGL